MLFLSNFCLDALYTIHQLLSLVRKAGKTRRKPETQNGYGRLWIGRAELEGRQFVCLSVCLMPSVHSAGADSTEGQCCPSAPRCAALALRDNLPVLVEIVLHPTPCQRCLLASHITHSISAAPLHPFCYSLANLNHGNQLLT